MTKIILEVTDEELKMLDSTGLLNMDMAGVLYQKITIVPANEESEDKE